MRNISTDPLVFYPQYCFQYSSTYNIWARLTAASIQALQARSGFEGQSTYFHLNHPIRWVRLVGVIVAFDVYPNRVTITLDDSSGLTIDIFCRRNSSSASAVNTTIDRYGAINFNNAANFVEDEHIYTTSEGYKVNLKGIDIGSVVKIKGGISEFRGKKQVTLERISLVSTTNEEASAWAENALFYQDILGKPWVVSERKQQQAKKEAEGVERERKARRERKRRKKASVEKQERKAKRDHERGNRNNRREVGNKRKAHKAERSSRREENLPASRHDCNTEAKEPPRPIVSGNFDALGL
ncbi:MAG: hypothetical protein LQ338_008131 [Usnochroma carphineum]|nr:MAG: hypothetical protein LQ338_008131 [Usnochroma carphineum]